MSVAQTMEFKDLDAPLLLAEVDIMEETEAETLDKSIEVDDLTSPTEVV